MALSALKMFAPYSGAAASAPGGRGNGATNRIAIWADGNDLTSSADLTYASNALTVGPSGGSGSSVFNSFLTINATGTGQFTINDTVSHASTGAPRMAFKASGTSLGTVGFPTANTSTLVLNASTASGNFDFQVNSSSIATATSAGLWRFLSQTAIGGAPTTTTGLLINMAGSQLTGTAQYALRVSTTGSSAGTAGLSGYACSLTGASATTVGYMLGCEIGAHTAGGSGGAITRAASYFGSVQSAGATGNAWGCDNVAFSGNYVFNFTSTNTSLFSGVVNCSAGVRTKYATTNTANPPTQAEMVTAFGAAATNGSGFLGVLNDNAGGTNEYLVFGDGSNYWYIAGTVGA